MIRPTVDSLRLFLHVFAASVWVGGQVVLAGLVPQVRRTDPGALQAVARAFAKVAWPAFTLAVFTGVWNVLEVDPSQHGSSYLVTLLVKLLLVGTAAGATLVHSVSKSKIALAVGGALGLLASLAVTWLGILLAHQG